jgi:hypothetical protein
MAHRLVYHIDSDNKGVGESHSSFNAEILIPDKMKYNRVALLQAEIPKSYYLVLRGKNYFTLVEEGVERMIEIPIGNYGRRSFIEELAEQMNLDGATIQYSFTWTSLTGKLYITVSGNVAQPYIVFDNITQIHKQLGFDLGSTNMFVGDVLESDNVCVFRRTTALYIKSDICMATHNTTQSASVLQEMFVSSSPDYGSISFVNPDVTMTSKPLNKSSSVYHFELYDTDGNNLDLNGVSMVFSIVIFAE